MGIKEKLINILGGEVKTTNSLSRGNDFLKYGSRGTPLTPDWSEVKMTDEDMYRGYTYAAIQKRGNKVASLARTNLKTIANQEVVDEYQKKGEIPFHPYLKLIENSTTFTEKQFWKNISVYLDLAGRYYLGVVRNHIKSSSPNLPDIVTDIKEFIMLNPYEIKRVINKDGEVAGYVERKKDGRYREWPAYQIIEMRETNPFDNDKVWAMTDAAKEAVYTIQESGDYTRQSLHGNLDAPGIITTDVLLNDEDFANFRARVKEHTKGEPLFGNGAGAIKWESMQIDLDRAALLDINEINRTTLFAVSGTSKTTLGIEQSGTTRETARVQTEAFISDTVQPRVEDIIDFLNLDYKKNYPREFKQTGYFIEIESAVSRDYDTEIKSIQARKESNELALDLIEMGYTQQSSYQYANGEIEWTDLELEEGREKPERPKQDPMGGFGGGNETPSPNNDNPETPEVEPEEPEEEPTQQEHNNIDAINMMDEPGQVPIEEDDTAHHFLEEVDGCTCEHDHKIETYVNDLTNEDGKVLTDAYQELLKGIREVQQEAIKTAVKKVTVNSFEQSDIITKKQKEKLIDKLKNIFKDYWFILMPLFANALVGKRNHEFGEKYAFRFTNDLQNKIQLNAESVATSHVDTILGDILEASNKAYTSVVETAAAELIVKAYKANPDKYAEYFTSEPSILKARKAIQNTDILEKNRKIYEKANKLASEGYDRKTIIKGIQDEYTFLSDKRANTIARNETSRAFTQSQYQADYQFLESINKLDIAYKQLYSRSGNPCPYCQEVINRGPIPFTTNFLDKGETLTINTDGHTHTFTANYEDISAGVLHVNCQCEYELIIKDGKTNNDYYDIRGESNNNVAPTLNSWLNTCGNSPEKEINAGGNPYHDPSNGQFTTGGGETGSGKKGTPDNLEQESFSIKELTGNTNEDFNEQILDSIDIQNQQILGKEQYEKTKEAIIQYTKIKEEGGISEKINKELRDGKNIQDIKGAADIQESCITTFDSDIKVVRSESYSSDKNNPWRTFFDSDESLQIEKSCQDEYGNFDTQKYQKGMSDLLEKSGIVGKGFTSVTTQKETTQFFASGKQPVIITATIKKGTQVCIPKAYNRDLSEGEIILPVGVKAKLKNIYQGEYTNREFGTTSKKALFVELEYYNDSKQKNTIFNGGAGSGNFGHSGRKGQVGGSISRKIRVKDEMDIAKDYIADKELDSKTGQDVSKVISTAEKLGIENGDQTDIIRIAEQDGWEVKNNGTIQSPKLKMTTIDKADKDEMVYTEFNRDADMSKMLKGNYTIHPDSEGEIGSISIQAQRTSNSEKRVALELNKNIKVAENSHIEAIMEHLPSHLQKLPSPTIARLAGYDAVFYTINGKVTYFIVNPQNVKIIEDYEY